MPTKVWTLAIWHVGQRRWVAAFTSPVQSRIESVCSTIVELLPAFAVVLEVPRDDVELIESMVAKLPAVDALSVFAEHSVIAEAYQREARRIAEAASEMASGRASVH